jgi:hypothetical protein
MNDNTPDVREVIQKHMNEAALRGCCLGAALGTLFALVVAGLLCWLAS